MNEKTNVKSASDARRLTDLKKPSLEKILESITSQAEYGNSYCVIIGLEISDSIIVDLLKMEFKIERFEDQLKNPCFKISW